MRRGWLVGALLAGCSSAGSADMDAGSAIGETSFESVATVMHGTSFIVLFDREWDCLDTAWVAKSYTEGQAPTEEPFVALQFTYDGDPVSGTQSVAGDSAVSAWGLDNTDAFAVERGREGTIELEEVSDDKIVGNFAVSFGTGGVSGTFESVYCRNLR